MKRITILICGFLFLTSVYAQKQIKGVSEGDTIKLSITELDYLITNSKLLCSKIDTLDDGAMIKTVEIECLDTNFRFVGAYFTSDVFFAEDLRFEMELKPFRLLCAFAIVDNGELYESYELDQRGMKYFESMLNRTPLVCYDSYE